MRHRRLLILLILLLLLAAPAGVASAAPPGDESIKKGEVVSDPVLITGGNLTIEAGAAVKNDVSVFGGNAMIAGDVSGDVAIFGGSAGISGSVGGDVILMGGSLVLSGTVTGDLIIFGGSLEAAGRAAVGADCVIIGGSVSGDGAANLNCDSAGDLPRLAAIVPSMRFPDRPEAPEIGRPAGLFSRVSEAAGLSLLMGLLALGAAAVAPAQLNQVSETIRRRPAASGAVGLLTAVAGPSLIALLAVLSTLLTLVCIGLLGFPIIFLLAVALVVGGVLGWVAAGTILGQRLAAGLNLSQRSLPVVAALGTAAMTFAFNLLGDLPFWLGGWVWTSVGFLIACAGLGAVALTRFGTRPYPLFLAANASKVAATLKTLPPADTGEAAGK